MKIFYMLGILLLAVSIQGCIPKYKGEKIYTTQEKVDERLLEEKYKLVARAQEAEIGNYLILYVPVKLGLPNTEEAIENTLAQKLLARFNSDILTNVKIESFKYFTVYWNVFGRKITADVWRKKD